MKLTLNTLTNQGAKTLYQPLRRIIQGLLPGAMNSVGNVGDPVTNQIAEVAYPALSTTMSATSTGNIRLDRVGDGVRALSCVSALQGKEGAVSEGLKAIKIGEREIFFSAQYDPVSCMTLAEHHRNAHSPLFVFAGVVSPKGAESPKNECTGLGTQSSEHVSYYPVSSLLQWWINQDDRDVAKFVDPNTGLHANKIEFFALHTSPGSQEQARAYSVGEVAVAEGVNSTYAPATLLYVAFENANDVQQRDCLAMSIAFLNLKGAALLFPENLAERFRVPENKKIVTEFGPKLAVDILVDLQSKWGEAGFAHLLELSKTQLAQLMIKNDHERQQYQDYLNKIVNFLEATQQIGSLSKA